LFALFPRAVTWPLSVCKEIGARAAAGVPESGVRAFLAQTLAILHTVARGCSPRATPEVDEPS